MLKITANFTDARILKLIDVNCNIFSFYILYIVAYQSIIFYIICYNIVTTPYFVTILQLFKTIL